MVIFKFMRVGKFLNIVLKASSLLLLFNLLVCGAQK